MVLPWKKKKVTDQQAPHDDSRMARAVSRSSADIWMTGNEAIFAANSKIANAIASMPIHLYHGNEIAIDHDLEKLISYSPNDRMTDFTWKQTMQLNVGDTGSAYSIIHRADNGITPVRVEVIDPRRVTPYVITEIDAIWYSVMHEDGKLTWVNSDDMIVIRMPSGNGERGISTRQVLRDTLGYDGKVKQLSLQQLSGVNNGIAISVPNTGLEKKQRDKIVSDALETYMSTDGRALVLQGGMSVTQLNGSSIDAHVLDIEKLTKNRVATVSNVPPHMLGDYSDASYSTAEQDNLEFRSLTLLPWVVQWEQELNRKLLTWNMVKDGYKFVIDMSALTRADTTSMANKHAQAIRSGWMTPNEVRAEDNLPPVDEGDKLLISRDLLPLTMVSNGMTVEARYASAPVRAGKGGRRR